MVPLAGHWLVVNPPLQPEIELLIARRASNRCVAKDLANNPFLEIKRLRVASWNL